MKNLRRLAYEFELDASQRKWVAKRNTSRTQVEHLRRLASPFGQGFKRVIFVERKENIGQVGYGAQQVIYSEKGVIDLIASI